MENRLFSTLDPRTRRLDLPGGETVLLTDTVGFVRKLPHQVVEAFRSTLEVVSESDLIVHVVDGSAPDLEGQIDAVRTVLAEIGADGMPELLVVNKADALGAADAEAGEESPAAGRPPGLGAWSRPAPARASTSCWRPSATGCGSADRVVELEIPWARGDVLAAVHREGEIVGEEAGEETTRIQVVLDEVGKARFRGVPGVVTPAAPRRPGPGRVRPAALSLRAARAVRAMARAAPSGSPDRRRVAWSTARSAPRATRRRPPSSRRWPRRGPSGAIRRRRDRRPTARPRPAGWQRRFGVDVDPDRELAACVGTKEFVATTAQFLHLRTPGAGHRALPGRLLSRPTPWGPRWPAAGPCRCPSWPAAGLDLDAIDDGRRGAGAAAVGQLARPTRPGADRPGCGGGVGTGHGVPVLSDECYAEFTWDGPPRTILEPRRRRRGGRPLAVEAVEPGRGAGRVLRRGPGAGEYLLDVRRHAGLMVPGPVQAGAAVALDDDAHVEVQRARYRERLAFLADVLGRWRTAGTDAGRGLLPVGAGARSGWPPTAGRWPSGWPTTAGLLVSPGELYGDDGAGHVRIAVVQPMDRLEAGGRPARSPDGDGWRPGGR